MNHPSPTRHRRGAPLPERLAAVIAEARTVAARLLSAIPPIREAQAARGAAELRARLAWAMFEARGGAR